MAVMEELRNLGSAQLGWCDCVQAARWKTQGSSEPNITTSYFMQSTARGVTLILERPGAKIISAHFKLSLQRKFPYHRVKKHKTAS